MVHFDKKNISKFRTLQEADNVFEEPKTRPEEKEEDPKKMNQRSDLEMLKLHLEQITFSLLSR